MKQKIIRKMKKEIKRNNLDSIGRYNISKNKIFTYLKDEL